MFSDSDHNCGGSCHIADMKVRSLRADVVNEWTLALPEGEGAHKLVNWKSLWTLARSILPMEARLVRAALPVPDADSSDEDLLRDHEASCSWPGLYYDKVQSLIGMHAPKKVVEIGVAYGYHARHILSSNFAIEYEGVDPYLAEYDEKDLFFQDVATLFNSAPNEAMNRLYRSVSEGLAKDFGRRASIIREESVVASRRFEDSSLPFVFLDGDHRYEAVKLDLEAWWPKVSPGGVLCGDDFLWPGVRKAVLDFFRPSGQAFFLLQSPDNDHVSFYAVKSRTEGR